MDFRPLFSANFKFARNLDKRLQGGCIPKNNWVQEG